MYGIARGITNYLTNAATMVRAQAHRGPGGSGMVTFEGGAGGAVRLALGDLSDLGQQLISCPDNRVAILFNGKMYNQVEQRSSLVARGYL